MMSQAAISADMMKLSANTKKNGEGRNQRKLKLDRSASNAQTIN